MSDLVDRWVEKLIDVPNIGAMTHAERVEKAFNLEEPDMVPVAPELDQYQIIHAGYNFFDIWDDYEKCTDAVLKTWADLRTDLIWSYSSPDHLMEAFVEPSQRSDLFDLRDGKSYVVFKEIAPTIDEAIKIFEEKPWRKYGVGRLATHWMPHMEQLIEFQRKMGNKIYVVGSIGNVTNTLDFIVGVQNFIRWCVTEPKEKLHYLMELATERQLEALDSCKPFTEDIKVWCIFWGGKTLGPRQLEEISIYDRIIADKAARIFKYPFFHLCGNNLPYYVDRLATHPLVALQYDEPMQQLSWSWPQWIEWVARACRGKMCAMNAPTCQAVAYRGPEDIELMIKDFIEHTTPHTTAMIMPGCQLSAMTPIGNVRALVAAGRKWGKYPECRTRAKQIWTEEEFQASVAKYGSKAPSWSYNWRAVNGKVPR